MRRSLEQWLDWQSSLHPAAIELGLERVRTVWQALQAPSFGCPVITIGGTNGKGSTQALTAAMLRAGGYRVGCYSSPHLLQYQERIRIDGVPIGESDLVRAFEQVELARDRTPLTYFEFGTLAALWLFARARLDALVLEVGLGGRLDAVNLVDADCAIVTSVDLDHTEWLGTDRESIGFEKAGIFRGGRPAIFSGPELPASVAAHARAIGAELLVLGRDFDFERCGATWDWHAGEQRRTGLPPPNLPGEHQYRNACAALMALSRLQRRLPLSTDQLAAGLRDVRLPGRLQQFEGAVSWLVDVAHNPEAVQALANFLRDHPVAGQTHVVFGAMRDKQVENLATLLREQVGHWYLVGLEPPRGLAADELARRLASLDIPVSGIYPEPSAGIQAARQTAQPGDRVLVFGSFVTAGAALALLGVEPV